MEKEKQQKDVLSDKKLEIITKDISEDIRAEVADICMKPSSMADIKQCSRTIKETLDTKYGRGWNVIMGESFVGTCAVADHALLQMRISGILILVFKSCLITGKTS